MKFETRAKLNGFEWCRECNGWKLYNTDGTCRDCGGMICPESNYDMLAELEAKYGA